MNGFTDQRGYRRVMVRKPGCDKPIARSVHRLVALAFLGPQPDGMPDVAHLDGNPRNNAVSNLQWMSHADNSRMMLVHGTAQVGEKSCTAKLTAEQVADIRAAARDGALQKHLAARHGVSRSTVCRLVAGRGWPNVT